MLWPECIYVTVKAWNQLSLVLSSENQDALSTIDKTSIPHWKLESTAIVG
jgi:hypothetical protein